MSILSSQMVLQNFLNTHHMIQVAADRVLNMSLCTDIIYNANIDSVIFYAVADKNITCVGWSDITSEPIRLMFQAEHDKYHPTSEVDNV